MLTEKRQEAILKIVDERKAVTVTELSEQLDASESTIRRDLTALDREGRLKKVHGGATALGGYYSTKEDAMPEKYSMNVEEKREIARYAATLVHKDELVYLDAVTTTEYMVDYLTEKAAVYVTNGIPIARKLALRGFSTYIIAGRIKPATESVIGSETADSLRRFNFTVGFFGTNCVSAENGFTTPDIAEARTKTSAMARCLRKFVLADAGKFGKAAPVTFAKLGEAVIITSQLEDRAIRHKTEVVEVLQDGLYRDV